MILRDATIRYSGRDPDKLLKNSNKRICVSCNGCGRVRWVRFQSYNNKKYPDLCVLCVALNKLPFTEEHKANISKSHKGKKLSEKHKIKLRGKRPQMMGKNNPFYGKGFHGKDNPMFGMSGELSPNWKGGYDKNRKYVLRESQCIKLNERFDNSEFHHITKSTGIFIPKNLHKSIFHSMKTGKNMKKINKLAFNYLINGL